jgi:hypothetical protein
MPSLQKENLSPNRDFCSWPRGDTEFGTVGWRLSLAEKLILVSKLALEMYLFSGSCLPLAVNVSANDVNRGTVEYRDNATLSAEVGSSLGGSGVREHSSSGRIC